MYIELNVFQCYIVEVLDVDEFILKDSKDSNDLSNCSNQFILYVIYKYNINLQM